MNEERKNDLFDISINEISKKYIRKIYPIGVTSFVLNIIFTIIFISLSVYNIVSYGNMSKDTFKEVFYSFYPVYAIVYSVITLIGNYFYFIFLRGMKRCIQNSNEDGFNSSFRYAYLNTLIFCISIILSVIFVVLEMLTIVS